MAPQNETLSAPLTFTSINSTTIYDSSVFNVCIDLVNRTVANSLCLMGVIGNILTIMVLLRHGCSDTTNFLLTSIAVCDFVFGIVCLFFEFIGMLDKLDHNLAEIVLSVYNAAIFPLPSVALMSSLLQVTVVAIERMIAVCFPFHVSRICTPRRIKSTAGFIIFYSLVFNHSQAYYFTEFRLDGSKIIMTHKMSMIKNIFITLLILNMFVLPAVVVITCYAAIALKLRFAPKNLSRRSKANYVSRDMKMLKMLFIVCCVAVFAFLPQNLLLVLHWRDDLRQQLNGRWDDLITVIVSSFHHFYVSFNFIIYVLMSSKFSNTFKRLICPRFEQSKVTEFYKDVTR